MRRFNAVVVLVLAFLAVGVVPTTATHDSGWCKRDLSTITIGTGNVAIDIDALQGVNHVDVAHPSCSGGRYTIDHSSDPVMTEQHCSGGFLRVYAGAGGSGVEFVVLWWPSGPGACP